jgi:hypothetical protein
MPTEVFWVFLVSSSCAFLLAVARICYKSKCKEIECCCIKIIRDVQTEEKEFEFSTLNKATTDSPVENSAVNTVQRIIV